MTQTVILLVDDEKTILDSLCAQLGRLLPDEIECESAESAEEAWELLAELGERGARVVVVVSDWMMPGQRGDEFLNELRARYPAIGRVLLTGQADPCALARARDEAAVHRILFKPWRPEDLQAAIDHALANAG